MLTKRQKEVLDFVTKYIDENGYGPTLNEINNEFEMGSASAAFQHVQALENKGYLKRLPNKTRAIALNDDTADVKEVPLMGAIAMGQPLESYDTGERIKVPTFLLGNGAGNFYALQAYGDSMNQEGIIDGDLIIIKKTDAYNNGDIVVAQLKDKGAILKKFYNLGKKIELRPKSSNQNNKPIFVDPGDVEIQGKFCGLIRKGN